VIDKKFDEFYIVVEEFWISYSFSIKMLNSNMCTLLTIFIFFSKVYV